MKKTTGAVIILSMGTVLVAGCGLSSQSKSPLSQSAGTRPSSPSTTTTAPSPSTEASSSISPGTPLKSTRSSGASANSSGSSSRSGVLLVKAWMNSGLKGEGPGMPIGDGKTIETVQREWGRGRSSSAGAGIYVTYSAHKAAFGVGPGDQIFDVRSDSSSIQKITREDVMAALGPPGAVRFADNTTIYMYPDGPNYQVLWTFEGGPGHTANTVNHVSVFWPQGTVNLMAQTVPNPSVFVTKNPASSGSFLPFSIKHAPSGYRLDELEWLPSSSGPIVVNTESQAITNGQHGIPGAGFMKAYGTFRLQFLPSMKNTSGKIRLIYESTRGDTIIGTSHTITLH